MENSIAIQKADTGEGHPEDKNFESANWSTLLEADTAQEALTYLVGMINADELDDANYFFRVVNTQSKEVL